MKRILPLCLMLAACQTEQPTVESINAKQAAREGSCEHQGYKRGSKDFYTCSRLAESKEVSDSVTSGVATQMAVGSAIGLAGMAAGWFSDERLKRDIVP